jgi:hypothetical protein
MIRSVHAVLATSLLAALGAQEPIRTRWDDRIAALQGRSSWSIPDLSTEPGAVPLGNGSVFAAAGRGGHACALTDLTGPTYADPAFGNLHLELVDADGRALARTASRIEQTTEAAFVLTEDRTDAASLRVVWFAATVPGTLAALVEVAEGSTPAPEGLGLRAWLDPGAAAAGDALRAEVRAPGRRIGIELRIEGAVPVGGRGLGEALEVAVRPGWSGGLVLTFATVPQTDGARALVPAPTAAPADAETLAVQRAAADLERARGRTRYDTDHARLRDLLRKAPLHVAAQTCAETGAVLPMLGDRTVSVRGQSGPLLLALRHRDFDAARRILRLWHHAATARGVLSGTTTLERCMQDRAAAAQAPPRDAAFWNRLEIAPGDTGSLVVLQHHWYWRASGDDALIADAWPLLEACIKRQPRRDDVLIPFAGDEPWLGPLATAREAESRIALVSEPGAEPASFAAGAAFLMAVHALADLADGLDRSAHPERWNGEPPAGRPGAPWVRKAFDLMRGLEERFFVEDAGRFAPAWMPAGGRLFAEPIAEANLFPLWVGFTFPSGDRSRRNFASTRAALGGSGWSMGSGPDLPDRTGALQALLLTALAELDEPGRNEVLSHTLDAARPTGLWASLQDPDGKPLRGSASADPGTLGLTCDAILFAMTGIRQATYARWDDDDIRIEAFLPRGVGFLTVRGAEKDGRVLDLFVRERTGPLDEEERAANDALAPDRRLDPDQDHRRVQVVLELVSGSPRAGYYDLAVQVGDTVHVDYLVPRAPKPGEPDLRRFAKWTFVEHEPAGSDGR